MYDIHNHLIYGVDDGSASMEESITMINQMIESGYCGAIATPHYDKGRFVVEADVVRDKVSEIRKELEIRGIDFKIYPGNEVQIDEMTLSDLKKGKIMSMNSSRYVLSELPMITMPFYAKGIFYEMRLNGYTPIIAHPERYLYIQKDLDILVDYIKSGCLVQINLDSLTNMDSVTAREMLERNMVHFVSTDAHSSKWRNAQVKKELDLLKEMVGDEKYFELTYLNPKRVIDNEYISPNIDGIVVKKAESKKNKRKWYKFWR